MPLDKKAFLVFFLSMGFLLYQSQVHGQVSSKKRNNYNYSEGKVIGASIEDLYTAPDFHKLGPSTKSVAILPIRLSILPGENTKTDIAAIQELAFREAYNARQTLYSYMVLERKKTKSQITFQNIIVTDSILEQNNITQETIKQFTPQELAQILGVESVILTTINRKEKIVQPNLLVDNIITTTLALFRSGEVNIKSYDARYDKKLTWYYRRDLTEGLGSETNQMLSAVMWRAALFFPYFK